MTKEEFLVIVKCHEIPMSLWYEYFLETSGMRISFEDFEHVFSIILWNEKVVRNTNGEMKKVTFKNAVDNFYDYYKRKFKLWEYETTDS